MWTRILSEKKIEEAMANGEFDDNPLTGQPVDLGDYFAVPAELRAGYALLKNARVVPLEVELMREIEACRRRVADRKPDEDLSPLEQKLREKELALRVRMEARQRSRWTG